MFNEVSLEESNKCRRKLSHMCDIKKQALQGNKLRNSIEFEK